MIPIGMIRTLENSPAPTARDYGRRAFGPGIWQSSHTQAHASLLLNKTLRDRPRICFDVYEVHASRVVFYLYGK